MPVQPAPDAPIIVLVVADSARSQDPALTQRKIDLYVAALGRSGGIPAPVSAATGAVDRDRFFATMAGLVLTGGPDLDPALYGEAVAGATDIDTERDALDHMAWLAAQERKVPIFGVCRGLQAINVFSGGSLLQDVPSHAGTPYGDGPARTHSMEIDPNSRLARALAAGAPEGLAATDEHDDTPELVVNTYHHQAVTQATLAKSLRAVGWASSEAGRLVEALESRDDHWVVGVQCHPERTESTPDEFEGVWEAFVRAAREAAEVTPA
ncbi:MAG TPA: gamma-glutamyl-gamma-aminobutyrate hydrolase family protein [Candidatus Limnocylindrales bacterium]